MPPPPPRPQQRVAIPHKCHPNVESLLRLQIKSPLDESEQKSLAESDVGRRLQRVLFQCRSYKDKYLVSRERYEKDKTSDDSKRQLSMDILQLQSCLASRACPRRYQAFGQCWSQIPPELVQEFQQAGLVHYMCQAERQSIERCAGELVSQAVRQADGEAPTSAMNDLMTI